MGATPLPQLHLRDLLFADISRVFPHKNHSQNVLNAAFNCQWEAHMWPCSYSCSYLFSPCCQTRMWQKSSSWHFPIKKAVSIHMCWFHLYWKQGWVHKGTKDNVIYLDLGGGALFRWKWLCLTLSFCTCRMDKTVYNEHICEPSFFWSFTFSSLHCDSFLSLAPSLNYHCFHISPSCFDSGIFSCFSALSLLCRSSSQPSVPYHYYEPKGLDECSMYLSHERSRWGSHHRFITEKTVFANWARTLNIHFHQPDWKPTPAISGPNSSHVLFPGGSWDADWRCGHGLQLINRDSRTLLLLLLSSCIISLAQRDGQDKAQTMFWDCNYNTMNFVLLAVTMKPCREI